MTVAEQSVLASYVEALGVRARNAARLMTSALSERKNDALAETKQRIHQQADKILTINAEEIAAAKAKGAADAFLDRMALNGERLAAICAALDKIAALDDPVGKVIRRWTRPNGLQIERVRTPIGVIAVIYESRPNVTIDAAAIAVKAGNAIILRGGSECLRTSKALFDCFAAGIKVAGLPQDAVQFVETTDRAVVGVLLSGLGGHIDLVIPRGGKSLVARVQQEARVAVLGHLDGLCHVYLDREANIEKAIAIAVNSKMRRSGVCGAAETLLIDSTDLARLWLPVAAALRKSGCELRGDERIREIDPDVTPASEDDWRTEYLAPILSVAAVDGVEGALAHIRKYSSGHTEAIVTENLTTAKRFVAGVDSAIVLHNASTQFADGGEFGLGAEIGIATGRLHARGPVGVEELTTYKNVVRGCGQVRS